MNTIHLRIFVAHAYHPKGDPYRLAPFRAAVKRLVARAREKVQTRLGVRLRVDVFFEMKEFRGRLSDGIQACLRACDVALADISENEANVFYELGFMQARRVPVLLVKSRKSDQKFPRPDDLGDALVCYYKTIADIERALFGDLVEFLTETVSMLTIREHEVEAVWFSREAATALLVASPEPEPSKFADPQERNYIYLDRFEDRDSLLELHGFLNRRAPWLRVDTITWQELVKPHIEKNLIIIGGPGDKNDPKDGNKACALFAKKHGRSRVRYGPDCESLIVKGKAFRSKMDADHRIVRDYGYFARFANPFNPRSTVILMNGIHTFGTLGSAFLFSDHPLGHHNIEVLLQAQSAQRKPSLAFEATFPVEVHEGRAVCPKIDPAQIYFF